MQHAEPSLPVSGVEPNIHSLGVRSTGCLYHDCQRHKKHMAGFDERQVSRKEHARPALARQKVLRESRKISFAKGNCFFMLKYVGMMLLIYRSFAAPCCKALKSITCLILPSLCGQQPESPYFCADLLTTSPSAYHLTSHQG